MMIQSQFAFPAKVVDNQDPDGLNRVRVSVTGREEAVSPWLEVVRPFAGSGSGMSFLPDVEDEVTVVSLSPDRTRQAVLLSQWYDGNKPPETGENTSGDLNQDGKNNLKFMKSLAGNMLIFDDTEGEEKLQVLAAGGESRFEHLAAEELVKLETGKDVRIGAKGAVRLEAEEVEIETKKQMSISAKEGLQVSSEKDAEAKMDKNLTWDTQGVSIN
jgi:uncharacterized protein involved in type VI secretion and phage assembly